MWNRGLRSLTCNSCQTVLPPSSGQRSEAERADASGAFAPSVFGPPLRWAIMVPFRSEALSVSNGRHHREAGARASSSLSKRSLPV